MFITHVKYIPRAANYTTFIRDVNYEKRFFDAITTADPLGGCSNPQTQVFLVENNIILGDIRQPNGCCCSDPDYQIKNSKSIKYRIVTNGCQCSYCFCDGCSCVNSGARFNILDSTHTQIVGDIFKSELSSSNDLLTYKIIFPEDATPDEKILIISSVFSIDTFNYRTSGTKNII